MLRLLLCAVALIVLPPCLAAQNPMPHPESEVAGQSQDYRSARSGRWSDVSTWQVFRSGVWVAATRESGLPSNQSNVFIEAGHTVLATRATTSAMDYIGAQGWAFVDVNNLNISTQGSITTTWGSLVGGFAPSDWYDGDRFGGYVSRTLSGLQFFSQTSLYRLGDQDTASYRPTLIFGTPPSYTPRPRNMELRIYGKLRYYSGSAANRTDYDARIQVTAATIGTGSTLVFRGISRTITTPEEWSTTLATQTGHFDNTAYTASMLASNPPERHNNFRGLMGRNSFWTAIFDLGRVVDRSFSSDQFTGPTDDPTTVVGRLQGVFTAGIVQVRRGTLRVEAPALLVNEGSVTSGVLHVMNNAVLQLSNGTNIGRTGVFAEQFANGSANPLASTDCRITSRMRYAVVEEGGAIDFTGRVGSLSAADVRFNGTVIYSRTGDQTLVQDSPYLSFNPAGPVIAPGLCAGENGLFDPYNNNFNANNGTQQQGDPTSGVISRFGSSPSGLGVGTAALFQPSTTAAYSHLVLRGNGTKFLPVTTVTISRALILQGEARLSLQNLAYPGVPVTAFVGGSSQNATTAPVLPYYLSQARGGELGVAESGSKAGFFPPLVYLRSTGLTGFREENNIGTTLRTSLSRDGIETAPFNAAPFNATPQPMWSAYGGNTDPVAFVGFTTASTRLIIYDQALYPEGASFPVGITLSGSTNREQLDMSPATKTPVVHGLPAEPSYLATNGAILGHGYAARGVFYGENPQTLDGARFGAVIRQTLDRVNGTHTATTPMQKPLLGVSNFVNGFPVITSSLYDASINTTATTTLQYDSELNDVMSQIEFPSGIWGAHNVVINCANSVQTLPERTADYRAAAVSNGVNWGLPHLNFTNRSNAITGASSGTLIAGPEHVITANGHLPRHAFNPRTGLFQPDAVYRETESGADSITPGTLASAYIDTRADEAIVETKINDRYYTTGVGARPSVVLTHTFDGRVRTGFPQALISVPSVFGRIQTTTATAPNDFGRRGDWNNFGALELRRGALLVPNLAANYTFTLSSTAILSGDQANVSYRGERVGTGNARAQVCLSDASGPEKYPRQTAWSASGVRFVGDSTSGAVVRGPAGAAHLSGILQMGERTNLVITGGTGGTIAVASNSALLNFRAQSRINTGFHELPATLGIPGITAIPPMPNDQSTNDHVSVNPAPDLNGFNNAWNLDLPYLDRGVENLTMLRGTSNILTLVGNVYEGQVTTFKPELSGLQVFSTLATARGMMDLNGRNIELNSAKARLVEAFERTTMPSVVLNRHATLRAYIGTTRLTAVPPISSSNAVSMIASGGIPLEISPSGLGANIIRLGASPQDTMFVRIWRWQTSTSARLVRTNVAAGGQFLRRFWHIATSANVSPATSLGLVLNYTDADVPTGAQGAHFTAFRGFTAPFFSLTQPETIFQAVRGVLGVIPPSAKQIAILSTTQTTSAQTLSATGNFSTDRDSTGAGFNLWTLGIPAPTSLVLRGQRFGGKFGEAIGAGFEGAGTDIVGFPRPFGSFTVDAPFGGISRTTAEQFGAIIGPFKAGVPTSATIIGEILDEMGNVAQFAPSTGAALVVGQVGGGNGPWNTGVPQLWLGSNAIAVGKVGAISRNGRFEWANVRLDGIASTTVTFTLENAIVDSRILVAPNTSSTLVYADPQPVQVSLQGGFAFSATFATQNVNNSPDVQGAIYPGAQGPFAVPGQVAANPILGLTGYAGSTAFIEVGKPVVLPYSSPGYSSITGIVKDRFGNFSSFPTSATLSIAGGSPPVDQLRTPLIGQTSEPRTLWGLGNFGNETGLARVAPSIQPPAQRASVVSPALVPTGAGYPPFNNPQIKANLVSFPNFQIWGATSSNVTLVMYTMIGDPYYWCGWCETGNTSATIDIVPSRAVGIAPVLMADMYNRNRPDRMPSRMNIGISNRHDPRTWFFVQAVDEFGNRVDNGPNAYNGGTAHIRFAPPEEGLPKNRTGTFQFTPTNDPYAKRNNQRYMALGTSTTAVNGLYTFSDFTPLGPASLDMLDRDVVLTFEDERLRGEMSPLAALAPFFFRPIPPITTATTTFVQPPVLTLSASDSVLNGARKAATNGLLLKERARTYLSTGNRLETGFLEVRRPVTALDHDLRVRYALNYFNAQDGFDTTAFRVTSQARLAPLPLVGTTTIPLPALIVPAADLPSPALLPPFPQPIQTAINGLQGDLAPRMAEAGVFTASTINTMTFDTGAVVRRIAFSARMSDQVYPRNAARQGLRLAVMRLLSDSTLPYRVEADSAFVALTDPAPAAPICINPLADKSYIMSGSNTAPIVEVLELEAIPWKTANGQPTPSWVFYDDNYEPLQYSARSADTTIVQVAVNAADMRFGGRPTLTYSIPPNAPIETSASIILTASDGRAQARDTFAIALRRAVAVDASQSQATMQLLAMPNPVSDDCTVEITAPQSGWLSLQMVNILGAVVWRMERWVEADERVRERIEIEGWRSGVYVLEARIGAMRSVTKVVRQ